MNPADWSYLLLLRTSLPGAGFEKVKKWPSFACLNQKISDESGRGRLLGDAGDHPQSGGNTSRVRDLSLFKKTGCQVRPLLRHKRRQLLESEIFCSQAGRTTSAGLCGVRTNLRTGINSSAPQTSWSSVQVSSRSELGDWTYKNWCDLKKMSQQLADSREPSDFSDQNQSD